MKPDDALVALLRLVSDAREARCRVLREQAGAQAAAILRQAHADARKGLREALEEARGGERERLERAQAQQRTRARAARQRDLKARLEQARRGLAGLLAQAWQDPAQRALWTERYALRALTILPPGRWEIAHPPGWRKAELERLRELLSRRGVAAGFTADPSIEAGLSFAAGNSLFDATLQGLLADRAAVEARLLFLAEGEAA